MVVGLKIPPWTAPGSPRWRGYEEGVGELGEDYCTAPEYSICQIDPSVAAGVLAVDMDSEAVVVGSLLAFE